jgi:hypothetical protein
MRTRRPVLVAGAVVACLVVGALIWALALRGGGGPSATSPGAGAGASGGGTPTAGPPTGPAGSAGAAVPPGASASGGPATGVPRAGKSPGGAGQADAASGFLDELGAIDPGLLGDGDRMLQAGRDTCADIKAGKPQDALVRDATQRFKTGGVALTPTKASLIVDAARNHLCPG